MKKTYRINAIQSMGAVFAITVGYVLSRFPDLAKILFNDHRKEPRRCHYHSETFTQNTSEVLSRTDLLDTFVQLCSFILLPKRIETKILKTHCQRLIKQRDWQNTLLKSNLVSEKLCKFFLLLSTLSPCKNFISCG